MRENAFAESFLAHLYCDKLELVLDQVPFVAEFPDVFTKVSGLPPIRETEFCIVGFNTYPRVYVPNVSPTCSLVEETIW